MEIDRNSILLDLPFDCTCTRQAFCKPIVSTSDMQHEKQKFLALYQ